MSAKYDKQLLYFVKVGDVPGVTKIVSSPVDLNCKDQDGNTPLLLASMANKIELVQILVDKGADVDITASDRNSCLHIASRDGRMEIVKILLAAHANPSIKNDEGFTALHEAAKNGRHGIVTLLLEAGAEIDAQDQNLYTPLHTASFHGQSDVMKLLISSGSNIDLKDIKGQLAVDLARGERQHDKIFSNPKLLDSNQKRRSITSPGDNSVSMIDVTPYDQETSLLVDENGPGTPLKPSAAEGDANAAVKTSPTSADHANRPLPTNPDEPAANPDVPTTELTGAMDSRVSSYRSSTNSMSPIQIVIHTAGDGSDAGSAAGSRPGSLNQQSSHGKIEMHKDSIYVRQQLQSEHSTQSVNTTTATNTAINSGSGKPSTPAVATPAAAAVAEEDKKAAPAAATAPGQGQGCCIIS